MFLAGRDDRFFPIEFQRRVARERLGKEAEEICGGHLVALSNAEGLTERLVALERGRRACPVPLSLGTMSDSSAGQSESSLSVSHRAPRGQLFNAIAG
jgi:hypothetical protein